MQGNPAGRRRTALNSPYLLTAHRFDFRESSMQIRTVRPAFSSRISSWQRRWQTYELTKRQFDAAFPDATPTERDRAILEIAKRLGV